MQQAEAMWLNFRQKNQKLIDYVRQIIPKFAAFTAQPLHPLVPIPGSVTITAANIALKTDDPTLSSIGLSQSLQTLMTYARSKRIYRIDEVLLDTLRDVDFPSEYPTSNPLLSYPCIALTLSDKLVFVVYDLATNRQELADPPLELRFVELNGTGLELVGVLDLSGGTLLEALDKARAKVAANSGECQSKLIQDTIFQPDQIKLYVNILLYIQGSKDVVALVHPGHRPKNKLNNKERYKAADNAEPAVSHVGKSWRATIEHWELPAEPTDDIEPSSLGSGRRKRPHMRAGHARFQRIGPRTDWHYELRYIQATTVGGTPIEIESDTLHVTTVK